MMSQEHKGYSEEVSALNLLTETEAGQDNSWLYIHIMVMYRSSCYIWYRNNNYLSGIMNESWIFSCVCQVGISCDLGRARYTRTVAYI